jgi:hypothetical protein
VHLFRPSLSFLAEAQPRLLVCKPKFCNATNLLNLFYVLFILLYQMMVEKLYNLFSLSGSTQRCEVMGDNF